MSLKSQILRIAGGSINTVNDAAIGQQVAQYGIGGSKFAGQLGKEVWLDDTDLIYTSSIGTVYGGGFRYVRLAAASAVPVVGQIAFWSPVATADNLYQVTADETLSSTDSAVMMAGIFLYNAITAGNYTIIQTVGPTFVKFCAALTGAGAVGSRVFAAAKGGADVGLADTYDGLANPATMSDVSLLFGRFIGKARQAPTNGGLKLVDCNFAMSNFRG